MNTEKIRKVTYVQFAWISTSILTSATHAIIFSANLAYVCLPRIIQLALHALSAVLQLPTFFFNQVKSFVKIHFSNYCLYFQLVLIFQLSILLKKMSSINCIPNNRMYTNNIQPTKIGLS